MSTAVKARRGVRPQEGDPARPLPLRQRPSCGGTSVASPLIAAVYALAGRRGGRAPLHMGGGL